ncbi:hypothetical protein HDU89_002024 [Geranomyces variabilis]|nr:hypothetical protein HDU89_002024 [Geranomyces variabilis]
MRSFLQLSRTSLSRCNPYRPVLTPLPCRRSITSTSASSTTTTISAFAQENGIQLNDQTLLSEALTHPSFGKAILSKNTRLGLLGGKVLSLYAAEHVHSAYPDLPADAVPSVVDELTGQKALQSAGQKLGIAKVMRWKPQQNLPAADGKVVGSILQALIGALYQDQGAAVTKQFITSHFLSRTVDESIHAKLANPLAALDAVTAVAGRPRPEARVLKETGANGPSPLYLVALFNGQEKLGDGYGSSKAQAEARAAKRVLRNHYRKELAALEIPQATPGSERITFFPPA